MSLRLRAPPTAATSEWSHDPVQVNSKADPCACYDETALRNLTESAMAKTPFPTSLTQQEVIKSDAPAILIKSGPGTGKTYALAARVQYLLVNKKVSPSNIVILSFSNRDAFHLKRKSLDLLFSKKSTHDKLTRNQLSERLWSGTIHAFSGQILRSIGKLTKSKRRASFRVITDRERRIRMDMSLKKLLVPVRSSPDILKRRQLLSCEALKDARQSRGLLMHYMKRCLELWKEANLLAPPSGVLDIDATSADIRNKGNLEACLEVALRLGVPATVARLAWEIAPIYQRYHSDKNTCDPSDLAPLAFHALLSNPVHLTNIRSKLHTMVLDEYQDISVAQHSLIRMLIRGIDPPCNDDNPARGRNIPPVLIPNHRNPKKAMLHSSLPPFRVPSLFCSGDEEQSIYGWRGAAPSLSVEGFRSDYPQGIVVPLDTSFRLKTDMWATVNLLGRKIHHVEPHTVPNSPVVSATKPESLVSIMCSDPEELSATVLIKGLRDAREEAKFIATKILKRSRDRLQRFTKSVSLMGASLKETPILDPTEVAILVRSEPEKKLVKEQLNLKGIPFVDNKPMDSSSDATPTVGSGVRMKPVVVMTMHLAKGFEFDDVYLIGFNEGVFPHPTAVSTNRVDEERRLAFVAISRARQQVTVTHSFYRVGAEYGKPSDPTANKRVTLAVKPSRFLYELVPDAIGSKKKTVTNSMIFRTGSTREKSRLPAIVWQREPGTKDKMINMKAKWRDIPKGFNLVDNIKANSWERSKRKVPELIAVDRHVLGVVGDRTDASN